MRCVVTFIAHGSPKQEANDFLRRLIAEISDGSTAVNLGFLGPGSPSIPEALELQIKKGAKSIRVIPLFLIPGKHLVHDISAIIEGVKTRYPSVEIKREEFVGNLPEFKHLLKSLIGITPPAGGS